MDKMMMRKKAMQQMMSEGPSIASKMKKKPVSIEIEMGEMEGEEGKEKGFVQMAVTPEEKEMIMAARKEKSGESDEEESDDMESEYA